MRLDKYLKIVRLIKRRTVANEACDAGKIVVNGKVARASYDVKPGDIIEINMGSTPLKAVSYTHLGRTSDHSGSWGGCCDKTGRPGLRPD